MLTDADRKVVRDQLAKEEAASLTMAAYVGQWLDTYRQSAGRVDQVRRTLDRHILPTLGHVPLRTLTSRILQAWVNDVPGAPTSVRNYAATLSTILNAAVDDDVLAKNPMRKVDLPALDIDQRRFLATKKPPGSSKKHPTATRPSSSWRWPPAPGGANWSGCGAAPTTRFGAASKSRKPLKN